MYIHVNIDNPGFVGTEEFLPADHKVLNRVVATVGHIMKVIPIPIIISYILLPIGKVKKSVSTRLKTEKDKVARLHFCLDIRCVFDTSRIPGDFLFIQLNTFLRRQVKGWKNPFDTQFLLNSVSYPISIMRLFELRAGRVNVQHEHGVYVNHTFFRSHPNPHCVNIGIQRQRITTQDPFVNTYHFISINSFEMTFIFSRSLHTVNIRINRTVLLVFRLIIENSIQHQIITAHHIGVNLSIKNNATTLRSGTNRNSLGYFHIRLLVFFIYGVIRLKLY